MIMRTFMRSSRLSSARTSSAAPQLMRMAVRSACSPSWYVALKSCGSSNVAAARDAQTQAAQACFLRHEAAAETANCHQILDVIHNIGVCDAAPQVQPFWNSSNRQHGNSSSKRHLHPPSQSPHIG